MRPHTLRPSSLSPAPPICAMTVGVVGVLLFLGLPSALPAQETGDQETTAAQDTLEHEVEKGDTLWDLAAKYLSDPFEWEEIYRLNQDVVEDPHWIYPGELLRLPDGRVVQVTEKAPEPEPEEPAEDPFGGSSIFDRNPSQGATLSEYSAERVEASPLISVSGFYRASFVADWAELGPRGSTARVIRENPLGLEMPPTISRHADVVLSTTGLQLEPGDTLQAIQRGRELSDGQHVVHSMGLVEVTEVRDDSARARVVTVFGGYEVGDPVVRAEPYRIGDLRRLVPAEEPLTARVLGLEEPQALVGSNARVFLDRGSEGGLSLGDELMVFPHRTDDPATANLVDRLGVVRVVRVWPEGSTARVVKTQAVGIRPGVPAVLVRRAASGTR